MRTVLLVTMVVIATSGCVEFLGTEDESDAPADPTFQVDETDDTWVVTAAPAGLSWDEMRLQASAALMAKVEGKFLAIDEDPMVIPLDAAVDAGDDIAFCRSGPDATTVQVTLTRTAQNSLVFASTFASVESCGDTNTAQSAPVVGFTASESDDRITVTHTPSGVSWDEYMAKASRALNVTLNTDTQHRTDVGTGFTDFTWPEPVAAGDMLSLCTKGGPAQEVRISLAHQPTNTLVFDHTFATIDACS